MSIDMSDPYTFYKSQLKRTLQETDQERLRRVMEVIPNCLDLLTNLLGTYLKEEVEEIGSEERLQINAALGYLISPRDIIPEEKAEFTERWKYYRDDAYLILFVINKLADSLGEEIIEEYWPNEEEKEGIVEELRELYKKAEDSVEGEIRGLTENIIEYAGLEKEE